jgi:hypothetical protein
MTGVELIVGALAAGASAGLTDATSAAINDAYAGLKARLGGRITDRDAVAALDDVEVRPEGWQARLGDELARTGAAADEEILRAARHLLNLIGTPAGGVSSTVSVNYGAVGAFNAPVTITNETQPGSHPESK